MRTYKSHVESVMFYAPAVWSPNASPSAKNELQKVVNSAARIATGCHSSTPVEDLVMEAQVLPAEDRLDMLSAQFLASALRPEHPSHAVVTAPNGPRLMKASLFSKHHPTVSAIAPSGITSNTEYRRTLKEIHTGAVSDAVSKNNFSRILGRVRPDIDPSESTLSRAERSALAQLRSGECQLLNDYLAKVGRSNSALCPECRFQRHTVAHLFRCDAVETNLSLEDLWTNPVDVATFLKSLPSFSRLASSDAPAPRPPPEPPPSGRLRVN